jgi:hypothetical protein
MKVQEVLHYPGNRTNGKDLTPGRSPFQERGDSIIIALVGVGESGGDIGDTCRTNSRLTGFPE